jgi:putative addiction module component (TIGR02574 family)
VQEVDAEGDFMSLTLGPSEIEKLSVSERLELIGLLWDSIDETDPEAPTPAWHLRELAQRRAAAEADPGGAIPWAEVKARLTGSE